MKEDDITKEKLVKKEVDPLTIGITEKIVFQMKKCVCKIFSNGSKGTGFFTKIPYKNKIIKVLITNNHVLGEKEIEPNKEITYIINNNDEEEKKIKIDKKRREYTNKELDVTIVEIDENKDDIHDYIDIDNTVINYMYLSKEEIINNYKNKYKNESVYILNYMKGENILVSYGLISEINEENGINHKCNTDNGSSGSPILSLKNNKLIGIHYGSHNKYELNKGTLIIYVIIKFNKVEFKEEEIEKEKKEEEIEEK